MERGARIQLRRFIGARQALIAFNANLNTSDLAVAKAIAKIIRQSNGGLPCLKAIGVKLATRGLVQVAAALALLSWPGPGLGVITALAALALVVAGVTALVEAARAVGSARWAGFGIGFAQVVLGVLALSWRDVAVLVVAIAFGVRLVVFAVRIALGRDGSQSSSGLCCVGTSVTPVRRHR